MNKVCLVGNLFKDPELRTTQNGINVVMFNIALNNGVDKDGNKRKPDSPTICVYEKLAENMAKYCKKGSKVGIIGRLKTIVREKEDGTKVYSTFVAADSIEFLSNRSNSTAIPEPDYTTETQETTNEQQDPYKDFGNEVALSDDDLPF